MKTQRSVRLKKYGTVYSAYINSVHKHSPELPVFRKVNSTERGKVLPKEGKVLPKEGKVLPKEGKVPRESSKKKVSKKLNDYQKFVKEESGKEKYKSMKGGERMFAISQQWEKKKRKRNKNSLKKSK
jgi:hypothetical protein